MIGGMVKSIALRGCHNLIAELGGAPDRVARAAGIPAEAFTNPDMSIDGAALASYFELAAMHCSTEDFGLRLARRQGLQMRRRIEAVHRICHRRPPPVWPGFAPAAPRVRRTGDRDNSLRHIRIDAAPTSGHVRRRGAVSSRSDKTDGH